MSKPKKKKHVWVEMGFDEYGDPNIYQCNNKGCGIFKSIDPAPEKCKPDIEFSKADGTVISLNPEFYPPCGSRA